MNTYLIGYDLIKEGQDYETLMEQIEKYGTWWHHLDSTWIIKTNKTALEIKEHLKQYIDSNDKLLVVSLAKDAAAVGFNKDGTQWLKDYL